jgi:hypothetical protein
MEMKNCGGLSIRQVTACKLVDDANTDAYAISTVMDLQQSVVKAANVLAAISMGSLTPFFD